MALSPQVCLATWQRNSSVISTFMYTDTGVCIHDSMVHALLKYTCTCMYMYNMCTVYVQMSLVLETSFLFTQLTFSFQLDTAVPVECMWNGNGKWEIVC